MTPVGTQGSLSRRDRLGRSPLGFRAERGVLVGLVSGLGASTAHQIGGGHTAVQETLLVTAIAVLACVALARSRMGIGRLALVALGTQAAFHLLMTGTMHTSEGMAMGSPGSSDMTMAGTDTPGLMLLTHALVAIITVALSRGADQALLDLARSLSRRLIPRLTSPQGLVPVIRSFHLFDSRLLPSSQRLMTPATNRGPPVLLRSSSFLP